jgi:hypothetical protein
VVDARFGHSSNILKKSFREVGIGVLTGTYKSCNQAMMYTVDFGRGLMVLGEVNVAAAIAAYHPAAALPEEESERA